MSLYYYIINQTIHHTRLLVNDINSSIPIIREHINTARTTQYSDSKQTTQYNKSQQTSQKSDSKQTTQYSDSKQTTQDSD